MSNEHDPKTCSICRTQRDGVPLGATPEYAKWGKFAVALVDECLASDFPRENLIHAIVGMCADADRTVSALREAARYAVEEFFREGAADGSGCYDAMRALRLLLLSPRGGREG